jgi:hypothetical protein
MDWMGSGEGGLVGEGTLHGRLLRDILMGAVGMLAATVIFILPHMNEPKKEEQDSARSRGNVRVEIWWPDEMDVDIDLWSQAPGDDPVGYSNKTGRVFNLVRDDLGFYNDLSGHNYEVSFTRGYPDGDYIVNVHWYSNNGNEAEIPVKALITVRKDDSQNSKSAPTKVLQRTLILTRVGHEVTVVIFKVRDQEIVDIITNKTEFIRAFEADGIGGP